MRTTRVAKFSPGLPQNQTCGCWASTNQTVEVSLNASWIVAGIVLNGQRTLWWREFSVSASDDNRTYIDWGNYTAANYSSSMALFSYPIKARYFRINIRKYANHYVNLTTGVPISVQALVSPTQPFSCMCPTLSSGECCPSSNMRIINDKCVWCMNPGLLSTVMVNGCGVCKEGTFEYNGRCVYRVPAFQGTNFSVDNVAVSDGVLWSVDFNITASDNVWLYLMKNNHSTVELNPGNFRSSDLVFQQQQPRSSI